MTPYRKLCGKSDIRQRDFSLPSHFRTTELKPEYMTAKRFFLYTSNRTEALAAKLLDVIEANPEDNPLAPSEVMVQNAGTARWLSFQIAQFRGIAFNIDFPFPAKVFSRLSNVFDPHFETDGRFSETHAKWALYDILAELSDDSAFSLVKAYCSEPRRRYQLASRLAALYDQYLIYRPDVVVSWEDRPTRDWQGLLWKQLLARIYGNRANPPHIARIWHKLKNSQTLPNFHAERLPPSLHIFGISSLAPLYLDFVDRLSYSIPIHVYLLQPTDMYWGDLRTAAQARRSSRLKEGEAQGELALAEGVETETSNPLLPLLGRQGQAFLDALIDLDPQHDDSLFFEPQAESLLSAIQSDMRSLENRSSFDASSSPPHIDDSLSINNCHNKRRECEVLKDFILDCINRDPSLKFSDFIVMAPEIQEYASIADAVFSDTEVPSARLGYSIADQAATRHSPAANDFLSLLRIPLTRITSEEIAALIDLPSISLKFDFSDRNRSTIKHWIQEHSILWGWDARFRGAREAYPSERATWSELRKIIGSGIALSVSDDQLYREHVVSPDIEGDHAQLAGRFLELLEFIENLIAASTRTCTLDEWKLFFEQAAFDSIPQSEDYQSQVQLIHDSIGKSLEVPSFDSEITLPYETALDSIAQTIERQSPPSGYLNGSITFCSLKPMRSIPARVICLVGMNLDDFPRKGSQTAFDLTKQSPRRGDRNPRDEDKQIFLEALLSTRQSLFISYIGQLDASDEKIPPSPVVSALIDYMGHPSIVRTHKRQKFDHAYFKESSLFTYSPEAANAANASLARHPPKTIQAASPTPTPISVSNSQLELDELLAYFRNPCRHYLDKQCLIRFPKKYESMPSDEFFESSALDQYTRNSYLIEKKDSPSDDSISTYFAARKWTASGYFGQFESSTSAESAQELLSSTESYFNDSHELQTPFDLPLNSASLHGNLTIRSNGWLVDISASKNKPSRILTTWICHLIASLNSTRQATPYRGAIIAGLRRNKSQSEPEIIRFEPIENANALQQLGLLVQEYITGTKQPRLLYSEICCDFAKRCEKNKVESAEPTELDTHLKAVEAIHLQPSSHGNGRTLYDDPAIRLCFGETPHLENQFAESALAIWAPILRNIQSVKGKSAR